MKDPTGRLRRLSPPIAADLPCVRTPRVAWPPGADAEEQEEPMAREDKAATVAELAEEFRTSTAAVLTEYRGLTVSQISQLRRSLQGVANYAVVKNTLTKIAAREAGVEGFDALLSGPSAIAFIKGDPVEGAKSLKNFAKDNPLLVLKAGYMDGSFNIFTGPIYDQDGVERVKAGEVMGLGDLAVMDWFVKGVESAA